LDRANKTMAVCSATVPSEFYTIWNLNIFW
jgi:hypothetical protein